jgi:hypothetical protein
MKNLTQNLLKHKNLVAILALVIALTSCSSYQNIASDDDGIYEDANSPKKEVSKNETTATKSTEENNATKYQTYFKSKAEKIKIETDEVFTDVDSYSSNNTDEDILDKDVKDFSVNTPSWEDSGETVVNVYNYNTYRPYYSWYHPYYRPFYSDIYISLNPW